jgi:hypothetical protein
MSDWASTSSGVDVFAERRPFDHDPAKHGHWYVTIDQQGSGEFVHIAEELFASDRSRAERVEGTTLVLAPEEARWLHAQLSILIERGRL